jgi:hypothetical protein
MRFLVAEHLYIAVHAGKLDCIDMDFSKNIALGFSDDEHFPARIVSIVGTQHSIAMCIKKAQNMGKSI